MNVLQKTLYTAEATAFGGRDGRAESSDKALNIKLSTPRELGAWGVKAPIRSNCLPQVTRPVFIGALKVAAMQAKVVCRPMWR